MLQLFSPVKSLIKIINKLQQKVIVRKRKKRAVAGNHFSQLPIYLLTQFIQKLSEGDPKQLRVNEH